MKKTVSLQVLIEQDEDGLYIADCPALRGCHAQGETFEEALENIKDVIHMCIEELGEEGRKVDLRYPEIIGFKRLEVAV